MEATLVIPPYRYGGRKTPEQYIKALTGKDCGPNNVISVVRSPLLNGHSGIRIGFVRGWGTVQLPALFTGEVIKPKAKRFPGINSTGPITLYEGDIAARDRLAILASQ